MKVSVRVGLRSGTKEALSLATSHVRHVLCQVRNTLLGLELIRGSGKYLQMRFEATRRRLVGKDNVRKAVGEDSAVDIRMDGQGFTCDRLGVAVVLEKSIERGNVLSDAGMRL